MTAPVDPRALLGPGLDRALGVLHVAAVWESPDGHYRTLRVGEGAIHGISDAVVLSAARARADAIVTTGRILREEPDLVHTSIAPPEIAAELSAMRRTVWGLAGPPWIAVLTGSGDIPADHPALLRAERLIFFTGARGAEALRHASALPERAEIVESASPGPGALVDHLARVRGARSIVIEAGASTAAPLYEGDGRVDELWLSVCQADHVEPDMLVGPFIDRDTIEATLGPPKHVERHLEGDVVWATLVHQRTPQLGR